MRSKRLKEATGSRRHRKRPEVEAVLEEYRKSGLTQRMFARREGIGVSTLQLWLRQARAGSRLRVPSGFGEEEVRRLLALLKEVE